MSALSFMLALALMRAPSPDVRTEHMAQWKEPAMRMTAVERMLYGS